MLHKHFLAAIFALSSVSAASGGNTSNPASSGIPEETKEQYRNCIIMNTAMEKSIGATFKKIGSTLSKAFSSTEGQIEEDGQSEEGEVKASDLLVEAAKSELPETPSDYCNRLLNTYKQRVKHELFENSDETPSFAETYDHPSYYYNIQSRTQNRIKELADKFNRNEKIRQRIYPETYNELHNYFNNETFTEINQLQSELNSNLRTIYQLSQKRIDTDHTTDSQNT